MYQAVALRMKDLDPRCGMATIALYKALRFNQLTAGQFGSINKNEYKQIIKLPPPPNFVQDPRVCPAASTLQYCR